LKQALHGLRYAHQLNFEIKIKCLQQAASVLNKLIAKENLFKDLTTY